jgi:hypothetical protein
MTSGGKEKAGSCAAGWEEPLWMVVIMEFDPA